MMGETQSTTDRLMQKDAATKQVEEARKAELEELKRCANRLFSSPDGKFWAKRAINWLGVNKRDRGIFASSVMLAAKEANNQFFLAFFKELLEPEVLMNIERGETK